MEENEKLKEGFYRLNIRPPAECTTLLYYGASGAGKTAFAGSAGSETLFINIGDGIETLLSPWFKQVYGYNPIVRDVNERLGARGMPIEASAFDATSDVLDEALNDFPDKFKTIVIDDVTSLRRFAMNKGLEINSKLGRSKSLENVSKKFDVTIPAVQDYGIEMNLIEQFIAAYTSLAKRANKHLIITAHQRITYRKGDKIGDVPTMAKVSPGFTGQTFPDQVPAYFDNVWHAEVVAGGRTGSVYRCRTVGDDVIVAKSRNGGVFSAVETNPNFTEMINRIQNWRK